MACSSDNNSSASPSLFNSYSSSELGLAVYPLNFLLQVFCGPDTCEVLRRLPPVNIDR